MQVTAVLSAINKRSVPPGAAEYPPRHVIIERSVGECIDSPLLPGQQVVGFCDDDLEILNTFCMQVG